MYNFMIIGAISNDSTSIGQIALIISLIASIVALVISFVAFFYTKMQTPVTAKKPTVTASSDTYYKKTKKPATNDLICKARLEAMKQTKEYTSELINYSASIFETSKRIIHSNIEIKKKNANSYTYKDRSINITKYNEEIEKFKITKSMLLLSYLEDENATDLEDCIEKIDSLRRAGYGAQIHSNIEKHEQLYSEYNEIMDEFVRLSKEYFNSEWDNVKQGK